MRQAPATPTTEQLHATYGISPEAEFAIQQGRKDVIETTDQPELGLYLPAAGGCTPPREVIDVLGLVVAESSEVAALTRQADNVKQAALRCCLWKPRTDPEAWHGYETTDPVMAYCLAAAIAEVNRNHVMEVASREHIRRYGRGLLYAWTGGRNADDLQLLIDIALEDDQIPLFNKNALGGDIYEVVDTTKKLNEARLANAVDEEPAPVWPMYRGGLNATSPSEWQYNYLKLLELTEGKMAVDTAHGSEMAHDPAGNFGKSVEGQLIVMDELLTLAQRGDSCAVTISEGSDLPAEMDPHAPLKDTLEFNRDMASARARSVVREAA